MNKYEFNIQTSCTVVVEAETKEEARIKLVDNDDLYYEELLDDPYISEGSPLSGGEHE